MSIGDKAVQLALQLRDCLQTELALRDNAPADTCFIPGEDGRTFLSVGLGEDRCCSGFAWVRVVRVTPSLPAAGEDTGNCGTWVWQVDYEIGVARCAPTGDQYAGPTCAQWEAVAVQVQSDGSAMRSALCCFRPLVESGRSSATEWLPFGPDGACTGGIMGVSVQVDGCDCDN